MSDGNLPSEDDLAEALRIVQAASKEDLEKAAERLVRSIQASASGASHSSGSATATVVTAAQSST